MRNKVILNPLTGKFDYVSSEEFLSGVSTDGTISGNGTASNPLSISEVVSDIEDLKNCCQSSTFGDYDKVIWVGDSITEQGISGTGYTDFIEAKFTGPTYVNTAVGAWTTEDVITNISTIAANGAGLYVVAIGTNDARYFDSRGAQSTTEFETNIQTIITALQAVGDVAIVSIWPTFWEDNYATSYRFETDERMVNWNKSLAYLARTNGCVYFDAYQSIVDYVNIHNVQTMFTDGVHPANDACKELYADALLFGRAALGKYSDEYETTANHFFKLVCHDNTPGAATGGYCGIKNISQTVVDKFSITANSSFSDITNLFGSYVDAYGGYYNKAYDFPLYLTFSTSSYPSSINTLGVVSGTGINRGIRAYDIYYSKKMEALTNLNHDSWELVETEKDSDGLMLNILPKNRQYINYMLKVSTIAGGGSGSFKLSRCGISDYPIRTWTQNVTAASRQRFDELFGAGVSTGNDLIANAPNFVLSWESVSNEKTIALTSSDSSLGSWEIYRSTKKSALSNPSDTSWTLLTSGTGAQTVTLELAGQVLPIKSVSTNYTATINDHTIICTAACTISLPDSRLPQGLSYVIKNNSTGNVIIDPIGSQTIDGQSTYTISQQYASIRVHGDNTQNWNII